METEDPVRCSDKSWNSRVEKYMSIPLSNLTAIGSAPVTRIFSTANILNKECTIS